MCCNGRSAQSAVSRMERGKCPREKCPFPAAADAARCDFSLMHVCGGIMRRFVYFLWCPKGIRIPNSRLESLFYYEA